MPPEYLTPDNVASRLQVSRQVVYNWINDGRLHAVRAGRTLRIPYDALEAFLQPVYAGDISTGGIEPEGSLCFDRFTPAAQAAAEAAGNEVRKRLHHQIEVEHVLWALLHQTGGITQQVFQKLAVDPQQVAEKLEQALGRFPSDLDFQLSPNYLSISERVGMILHRAEELANQIPDLQIDASHVLLAISKERDGVSAQILRSFGLTPEQLQAVLLDFRAQRPAAAPQAAEPEQENWEQRIEQQLARIVSELAAIRSILAPPGRDQA